MRLSLTGRQIDVPPALRQLVTRRLERLERVFNDTLVSAQVVLSKERHLHQAELIIRARGDHTLSAIGGGTTWAIAVWMLAVGWKNTLITEIPASEVDSMCSMSLTVVVRLRSFCAAMRCPISVAGRPP